MNISEVVSYDKEGRIERLTIFKKLFVPAVIILVAGLSFGIGRLSVARNNQPINIEYDESLISNDKLPISNQIQSPNVQKTQTASAIQAIPNASGEVVVSKNGTKYHFLHCGGAKQIKEENKITFPTPAAAEAAGYTLASNCKPK